jgi:CubicO group peptidase (beta-lactamase class C family)
VYLEDIVPVNPLAKIVDYSIDHQNKSVTSTSFGFFPLQAIYREGCGCSLVIGTTAEEMRQQKLIDPRFMQRRPFHRLDLPWPNGIQGPADPADLGVDTAKLDRALDEAFSEPVPGRMVFTRAVVVVYKGRMVAERYAPGFNKDMPLLGWSMAKSITNSLVGILVRQGKLDIHQFAPVPEWQKEGDARKKITLDQLLRMSSGLAFEEIYLPLTDVTEMLYSSYDFAAVAAAKPLEAAPDEKWNYSGGTANIVARIVRRTTEPAYEYYYDFMYQELFDKIGMYSALIEPDSAGTFVGSSYAYATPRDWARFGMLYLQDGVWEGERILPEGWVQYTTTPTPKAPQGEYGAHFWLNAGAAGNPIDRRWPNAPTDTFAALGFQMQRVLIIPSKNLVLVRFGATADREAWDDDAFITNIIAALP